MGIGLPESNQYVMLAQVYEAALPFYLELITIAATKSLLMADDTSIKILDWMAGKGPPTKNDQNKKHKRAVSTAIVAKSDGEHTIVLYLTDELAAGRHVDELLSHKTGASGATIYMSDGLAVIESAKNTKSLS